MKQLKCKDYFIIKVRYYASEYYLKKFLSNETVGLKKQHEAAKKHTKFFWSFIEKVLGQQNYYEKYYYNAKECVIEEVNESHGIIIVQGEGYYKYFIPKSDKNVKLVNWMETNLENPFVVLRKTYIGFLDITPTTYYREIALDAKNKK